MILVPENPDVWSIWIDGLPALNGQKSLLFQLQRVYPMQQAGGFLLWDLQSR